MHNPTLSSHRSKWIVVVLVTVLAILAVGASSAQQPEPKSPDGASFQTRGNSFSIGSTETTILPGAFPRAPFSITQSVDPATVTSGNSVSCNAGGLHADNHYLRVFDLATDFGLPGEVEITSVDLGIELATGVGGDQPISIDLYTSSTNPPTFGSMTLIQANPVVVADTSLVVQNFPVTGTIPAGSILVVDVFTPEGQTEGNSFFIGSNAGGQNDPSYLAATDCGVSEPTDTATIGFPNMHIVMVVNGDDGGAANTPTETPTDEPTATATDEPTNTPGGPTETPTDIPPATVTPTVTEPPGTELLINGDFENRNSEGKPEITPWTIKNATGDKGKCSKDFDGDGVIDKYFAHTGDCAFRFKGKPAEAGKLQQVIDLSSISLNVGDTINLYYHAQTTGGGTGKNKVVIKHSDDVKTKISTEIGDTGGVYLPFVGSATVSDSNVIKAKIKFKMTSEFGKLFLDSVHLHVVAGSTATPTEEATSDGTETATIEITETPTVEVTETPTDDVTETPTETETPAETETPTETPPARLNGSN